MKYKIDIYTLNEKATQSSGKNYNGSIVFETKKNKQWVFDFLHHGGGGYAIEGIGISTYDLKNLIIVEIEDYFRDVDFFQDLIIGNENFKVIDVVLLENQPRLFEDTEFLFFDDQEITEELKTNVVKVLNELEVDYIKSERLYEWGASGYFESYLIGILSSLTVEILGKLLALGLTLDNLKRFKLPTNIKKTIAKEYNINPENLFLESYFKNENGIVEVRFRDIELVIDIKIKNEKLIELNAMNLNTYIESKTENS